MAWEITMFGKRQSCCTVFRVHVVSASVCPSIWVSVPMIEILANYVTFRNKVNSQNAKTKIEILVFFPKDY